MTLRRIYLDGAAHPETDGLCQIEVSAEGASHEGEHLTTEWKDGEMVGPLYWPEERR